MSITLYDREIDRKYIVTHESRCNPSERDENTYVCPVCSTINYLHDQTPVDIQEIARLVLRAYDYDNCRELQYNHNV